VAEWQTQRTQKPHDTSAVDALAEALRAATVAGQWALAEAIVVELRALREGGAT
jgi:hypothetical protein